MQKGKLIICSAPSGAGKTTIVKHLLDSNLNLEFSISATSRKKRFNEADGRDYYFFTVEDFKKKIKSDLFLEWEEVYHNQFYGTLKSEVDRIWNKGRHVIFDVDVVGGLNIKKQFKDQALSIYIMPPSEDHLEQRLRSRLTEDEDSLLRRLKKARIELAEAPKFDKILINDDLSEAKKEAVDIVSSFLES